MRGDDLRIPANATTGRILSWTDASSAARRLNERLFMTPAEISAAFDEAEQAGRDHRFWEMMRFISDDDQRLLEWEPRVRSLLSHPNELFVAEAITVLASRWKLPEFRAECLAFAGHDDHDIRTAALFGLDSYGLRSGDYELASFFAEVLANETRHHGERAIAASAIPRTLEGNLPEFIALHSKLSSFRGPAQEFNELVPWNAINKIMDKHRP